MGSATGQGPPAGVDRAEPPQGTARDWRWRSRIRRHPPTHRVYRIVVAAIGAAVVAGGLVMVPFPGPGWLVVFFGVAILASEFDWATRLLGRGKELLAAWEDWARRQGWPMRILVLAVTGATVLAFFWVLFILAGVPAWLPDAVEAALIRLPGLG